MKTAFHSFPSVSSLRCVCLVTQRSPSEMSYALARPMKSCCKLLVPLWAGRRNSMQVEINTSYNFRIMRTDCCNICNLSLFLSSGMFSISQMKNRPMILIGGWHSCTYKDLIRVSLMFCIRIGSNPHPCTFLLKDQRMLNQKVQLWLNFTLLGCQLVF